MKYAVYIFNPSNFLNSNYRTMKTSIKTMTAVFMAGLVMTGCLNTDVAPEVKAIREQQVALLAAKAQLQVALAKSQEIENAHETIMNGYSETQAEAQLQATLADIDVQTKLSEAALEAASLQLQQAVDAMAEYIAQHGSDVAADYLVAYQDAAETLNDMVGEKVTKEAELATATAILNSVNSDWVAGKAAIERQKAREEAKLDAQTASLADLKEVAAGTQDNADLLTDLTKENQDLEVAWSENRIKDKKQVAVALAAQAELNAGNQTISDYNNAVNDTVSTASTLAGAKDDLADYQDGLAAANAVLAVKSNNFADWKGAYTPLKATYDTKVAATQTKLLALQAAENDLTVAQQKEAAGTGTAAQTTAAQTAKDAAQTAYDAAVTAENDAYDDLDQVDDGYFNAESELENAQNDVNNWQNTVDDQAAYVSEVEVDLVDEKAMVADLQEAFDAVDIAALQTAVDAGWREEDLIDLERDQIEAQIDANEFVINALNDYYDNLDGQISDLEDMIADTNENILDYDAQLNSQNEAKAGQQAEVDTLTAELAQITGQIAAQQAIVDAKLDALNSALGL